MSNDETSGIFAYDLEPSPPAGDPAELAAWLAETCPECGTPGPLRHFAAVNGCAVCMAEDPRPVCIPLRNVIGDVLVRGIETYDMELPTWPRGEMWATFRDRMPRVTKCYQMASGAAVHVKPGCRC